jgi:hypothetical protein
LAIWNGRQAMLRLHPSLLLNSGHTTTAPFDRLVLNAVGRFNFLCV